VNKAQEISPKYILYTAMADLTNGSGEFPWSHDILSKLVKSIGADKPITVQSLLSEMERNGYIKRTRKADGRSIDTVRLVTEPPIEKMQGGRKHPKVNGAEPQAAAQAPIRPVSARINTPMLDEYRKAKEMAESVSESKWLSVEFRPDPLAEEFLTIYNSHVRIIEKFNAQSAELAEANRALGFFRRTQDATFKQALRDAGVAHGD
jgi:hypothetical protein